MSVSPPELARLGDMMAITEVLHRYCRGIDRMDRALVLGCWHPGGTDEHTPLYSGTAAGFVEWVWGIHAAMVSTRHVTGNVLIEIDGDDAWVESYWDVMLRTRAAGGGGDALVDIFGGGRYLDHFERIGGRWAIRHRRSVHDWDRVQPVTRTMADGPATIEPAAPDAPIHAARRDGDDPSYAFLSGHRTGFLRA